MQKAIANNSRAMFNYESSYGQFPIGGLWGVDVTYTVCNFGQGWGQAILPFWIRPTFTMHVRSFNPSGRGRTIRVALQCSTYVSSVLTRDVFHGHGHNHRRRCRQRSNERPGADGPEVIVVIMFAQYTNLELNHTNQCSGCQGPLHQQDLRHRPFASGLANASAD